MVRITKDDRCLIKGLRTEKNMGEGQTPNKRFSEQHYSLACIFFIKNYSHFCNCLWTINVYKSNM